LEAAAVITDEVYVEIELLRKHGMTLCKIAAEVGCMVNTVGALNWLRNLVGKGSI